MEVGKNGKIRVVIADDNIYIRIGIRRLLELTGNIVVVGEAKNGKQALEMVSELLPDVLVLDVEMPVMGGIEVMDALKEMKCNVHILILSAYSDPFFVHETFMRGAKGYILKEEAPTYLTSAVNMAAHGELSPGVSPLGNLPE